MAKKEVYRLAALLDIREKKKEEAERYLGECIGALKEERDRQAELEQELERMIADREKRKREYAEKVMRGEMSAQDAVGANKFIDRLKEAEAFQKEKIEAQKAVVAQKEAEVEGARADLVDATQQLKALEKHKEKWEEQVKKEQMAKEEDQADDIAQTLFLSKQRKK